MIRMKRKLFFIVLGCFALSLTACSPEKTIDKVLDKMDPREEDKPAEEESKPKIEVAKPEITANLGGTVNYVVGQEAASLTFEAKVSDKGTLTYQWYRNTTNSNGGGSLIEGANSDNYIPPTTEEGTIYYYAVATNTIDGSTNGATTDTVEVVVTTEPVAPVEEVPEEVKTGWQQDERGWWYGNEDGSFIKNEWKEIKGKWYCFDERGYARLGWYQQGEDWYYFNADRSMATDMDIDGYHLGKDGKMTSSK